MHVKYETYYTTSAVVQQDLWCWKNKSLDVTIQEKDVTDMQFIQSGYVLKCSLTHNITLVSKQIYVQ